MRVEIVEECEEHGAFCSGEKRRVLTEGEFLLIEKVDGEWAERDIKTVWLAGDMNQTYREHARAVLDALAGGSDG